MTKITSIKNRAAELMITLLEGTLNGIERLQTALNRALNKATGRLNACISARIESFGDSLIVQASAETAKPFTEASKVTARIDKLNKAMDVLLEAHLNATTKLGEQRAAYLTDEELAKAREKSTALLLKRRELLNRQHYF